MQTVMTPALLLHERIKLEQLNIITGCIGSVIFACIFYFIMVDKLPQTFYLNFWLLNQFILLVLWSTFALLYKKSIFRSKYIWHLMSSFTSLFYGLLWSGSWFLFIDINDADIFFPWLYILTMILVGGMYATIFHLPSVIIFIVFLHVPIIIDILIYPVSSHTWLLYAFIANIIMASTFSVLLNRFILAAIEQREKNYLLMQQVEKEKQQVEKASQEKTRFLAAASHDLRQPIQSIRLFEYILSSRLTASEDKDLLKKLNSSINSLASLLDSLLDLSKLDAGVIKIDKQFFCVDEVLTSIKQQYQAIAAEQSIELRYVPSHVIVESDPQQLERMVRNLVVNAIKHMGTGTILLGVRRHHSAIVIKDNGIGIPAKEKDNIFQEFYQLNNPERNRSKGLGLGLAIVQRTAQLLGHRITIESELNKGCTFTIQLPLIEREIDNTVASNPDRQQVFPPEQARCALIVEDDQEVLQGMDALLSGWGYTTILASNKADAIRLGQTHPIEVIVSDYQLQNDDNGVEVIFSLRDYYQTKLPAILLTGNTNPMVLKSLSEYRIPILNKPFPPDQLAQHLKKLFK